MHLSPRGSQPMEWTHWSAYKISIKWARPFGHGTPPRRIAFHGYTPSKCSLSRLLASWHAANCSIVWSRHLDYTWCLIAETPLEGGNSNLGSSFKYFLASYTHPMSKGFRDDFLSPPNLWPPSLKSRWGSGRFISGISSDKVLEFNEHWKSTVESVC